MFDFSVKRTARRVGRPAPLTLVPASGSENA